MKLHEPKPSGLMANPAFANVVNMNFLKLNKTEEKRAFFLSKLLESKGEELAVQPDKCLDGHGRGGR